MTVKKISLILVSLLLIAGCTTFSNDQKHALLPKHEEVLIYDLPFDLTFLRTMEALQINRDWELQRTEKERGIISVFNRGGYSRFGDQDKYAITFLVKRITRDRTSVSIAPEDQRVPGGGKLLENIASVLGQQY